MAAGSRMIIIITMFGVVVFFFFSKTSFWYVLYCIVNYSVKLRVIIIFAFEANTTGAQCA
jgi:hypothetical protein